MTEYLYTQSSLFTGKCGSLKWDMLYVVITKSIILREYWVILFCYIVLCDCLVIFMSRLVGLIDEISFMFDVN